MSKGSIQLFVEELDFTFTQENLLISWIQNVVNAEAKELSYLNIILCSDEALLKMNIEYLNHDYYTDILTFQYNEDPIEGELFISLDRVRDNAESHGIPLGNELNRVIVHGTLHLIGYNDQTKQDKAEMRIKEDQYLSILKGSLKSSP